MLTFLAAKWSIPRDIWKANDMKSLIVTACWHSVLLGDFVFMTEGLLLRKNSRRLPWGAYSTTTYRKSAPRKSNMLCILYFVSNVNYTHFVYMPKAFCLNAWGIFSACPVWIYCRFRLTPQRSFLEHQQSAKHQDMILTVLGTTTNKVDNIFVTAYSFHSFHLRY